MLRLALLSLLFATSAFAQEMLPKPMVHQPEGAWADFPTLCTAADGTPWVAYVQWDGKNDSLHVVKLADGALKDVKMLGEGIIHQPALAVDGKGAMHAIWSQVSDKNLMELNTHVVREGELGEIFVLASSPNGGNAFAKAATDASGKVWSSGRACAAPRRMCSAAFLIPRRANGLLKSK